MGLHDWCNITGWEFIIIFSTFGLKEWKTYIRVNQIKQTKSGIPSDFLKKIAERKLQYKSFPLSCVHDVKYLSVVVSWKKPCCSF